MSREFIKNLSEYLSIHDTRPTEEKFQILFGKIDELNLWDLNWETLWNLRMKESPLWFSCLCQNSAKISREVRSQDNEVSQASERRRTVVTFKMLLRKPSLIENRLRGNV